MKKINKKIFLSLLGTITTLVPIVISASCSSNVFDENQLALLKYIQSDNAKKDPTIDLSKYAGKTNIPLEKKNFRADVLACLGAFKPPASVTQNGKTFKYSVERVNHILGTTKAEILMGVTIDGFVNSDNQPYILETYTVVLDGFKLTPINHKHWVKTDGGGTLDICLTFNQ